MKTAHQTQYPLPVGQHRNYSTLYPEDGETFPSAVYRWEKLKTELTRIHLRHQLSQILGNVWNTWSENKVCELIAVKVLHSSLLNTTEVAFKVLPSGSYAPMPAPSPPFKTIFGTGSVEWPSELPLYFSWCHQCHQNAFISIFPLYSGTEKSHWGLDPVNGQGVPTQLFV